MFITKSTLKGGGGERERKKIVCLLGQGGSCEKCISCIAFLFLIFHALWIYLNPLRWIQKEKKGKAEVRDMQNKRHLPLANGLPLSSSGFLFLSCFLFFSLLEGSFLKSFRDIEPKTMPIKRRREGNSQVCVCVWCVSEGGGIPKMVAGQPCMFKILPCIRGTKH